MVELVRTKGSDDREYIVRPTPWDLAKVEEYWGRIKNHGIFSDNMPKSPQGFLAFIMSTGALWFEIVDVEIDTVVGLMYLTDVTAGGDRPFVEATWHAMVWDARAGVRRPVFKAAIQALFDQFGFHRLRTEIPLQFGGVIRQAKKIGFKEEGRIRESAQYNGIWFDSLLMSVLDKEAREWAR